MNCKFCDREMFKLKPEIGAGTAYDCFRCPRSVRFFYSGEHLDGYIIFVNKKDRNLNDHLYAVVFRPDENKAGLYTAYSASYGSSSNYLNSFQMHQCIAEFGHIPNITPANIHDKLKLYMLFS